MKIKTAELIGMALNWAVATCEGVRPRYNMESHGMLWAGWWIATPEYEHLPKYSTDWAQGGPIIDREKIALDYRMAESIATMDDWDNLKAGPTPLIAAMRCFIASKLGDEIEIPEELK